MSLIRRVTLRCLCEDLVSGWNNSEEQKGFIHLREAIASGRSHGDIARELERLPTSSKAAHPLVTSFYTAFEAEEGDVQRESISGLSNPHWWKQKVSRWRGAATDAREVASGEVWLCAGGLRRGNEASDFYASFMNRVNSGGAVHFLPTSEDRTYQDVEQKVLRLQAWEAQLRLSALICVHEAGARDAVIAHVPNVSPASAEIPLAHFTFDLFRVQEADEDLTELILVFRVEDHTRAPQAQMALDVVRAVIEADNDAWQVLPGRGDDQVWSVLVNPALLLLAKECVSAGTLPDGVIDASLQFGVRAHYTPKDGIVEASVNGSAVRALCNRWFVPTTNPDSLPVCATCSSIREVLPT